MSLPALKTAELDDDPYPYGWRWIHLPGGGLERVARTYEDFLDPQEGDEMGQDSIHWRLCKILFGVFEQRFPQGGEITVFGDLRVEFADPSLRAASPDVCVVRGVEDPGRRRTSYFEAREKGEILLLVEVVSPRYASKDYERNPEHFEAAGVPEYLIVDLLGDDIRGPYRLTGYRLDAGTRRYRRIEADERGGLRLATVALRVAADPRSSWGLRVEDAVTGELVPTDAEAAVAAERRAEQAERRAEEQAEALRALEAEVERLRSS